MAETPPPHPTPLPPPSRPPWQRGNGPDYPGGCWPAILVLILFGIVVAGLVLNLRGCFH